MNADAPTLDEWEALPLGTLARATYVDPANQVSTQLILRIADNGASSGGASLMGGVFWARAFAQAESVEILYSPAVSS